MIQTIILYISVFVICFLAARRARLTNNKKWLILIIAILSLLAGLRNKTVGCDTQAYVQYFEMIVNGQFDYIWGIEKSFKVIMLIISKVCKSYTALLMIMAIITNTCIVLRFWDFKDISKFEWTFVVYYAVFYFFGFNIIRQMCAVAIIFWGSRFIERRRYGLFIASIMLGYLFHTSALLGLILLPMDFLQWNSLNTKQKRFFIIGILLIPIAFVFLFQKMSHYLIYFLDVKFDIGVVVFGKILFFFLSLWGLKRFIIRKEAESEKERNLEWVNSLKYTINTVGLYYFAGLLLCLVGYFYPLMDRISLYVYIFECVYMGILMKYKSIESGYPIIIVMLYGLIISSAVANGGQGQVPYLFFWQ